MATTDAILSARVVIDENQAEASARRVAANMEKHFALGRYTTDFKNFQQSIDAATSRVTAFGLTAGIFFTVKASMLEIVKSSIEVEKGLANINVVLGLSSRNLKVFSEDLFRVAANTGQTFAIAAKAATEFSRQGLGVEETLKRTRDALNLSRLAGIDTMAAVSDLTAAMNSFSNAILDSTQLVSKFVAVDQRFAVSSADLAEAIKRVGSTAQDAGVPIDDLIGIITALQERTARGGAVIGQSLKTIFTKVQNPEVLNQLEVFGIKVRDLGTRHLLPTLDILKNVAGAMYQLGSSSERFKIENLIGNLYQINQLKSVLADLKRTNSTTSKASAISSGASTESLQRSGELNQTLDAQLNRTGQNLKLMFSRIGEGALSPNLKDSLNLVNNFLESVNKTDKTAGIGEKIGTGILKGIGDVLFGPAAITLFAALGKIAITAIRSVGQAIGSFTPWQQSLKKGLDTIMLQQSFLQSQSGAVDRIVGANAVRLGTEREILGVLEQQNVVKNKSIEFITRTPRIGEVGLGSGLNSGTLPNLPYGSEISRASKLAADYRSQSGSPLQKNINAHYARGYDLMVGDLTSQQSGVVNSHKWKSFAENNEEKLRIGRLERMRFRADQSARSNAEMRSNPYHSTSQFYDPKMQGNIMGAFPREDFPFPPNFSTALSSYNYAPVVEFGSYNKAPRQGVSGEMMNHPSLLDATNAAGNLFVRSGSRNSAMNMLQGIDPLLAASMAATRQSKIQRGMFSAGFLAPMIGNTIGELAFDGEGQDNRVNKAISGGIGNTIGIGATMGALTGGPVGATIGTTIGLIRGLKNVFEELNTVLPEVKKSLIEINESISRRGELFGSLVQDAETMKNFKEGNTPVNNENVSAFRKRFNEKMGRLTNIGLDQSDTADIRSAVLRGDPGAMEKFRDLITPQSLTGSQSIKELTMSLGSIGSGKESQENFFDEFSRLRTSNGNLFSNALQNPAGQAMFGRLKMPSTTMSFGRGDLLTKRNVAGDYREFEDYFQKNMGNSSTSQDFLKMFRSLPPESQKIFIEGLMSRNRPASQTGGGFGSSLPKDVLSEKLGLSSMFDIGGSSLPKSYISQMTGKPFFNGEAGDDIDKALKGVIDKQKNPDLDIPGMIKAAANFARMSNARSEIVSNSLQAAQAGGFSISQAENQAAISRASYNQSPSQIAALQSSLAFSELSGQNALNVGKINAGAGKALYGGISNLRSGLTSETELKNLSTYISGLQGGAQGISTNGESGLEDFKSFLGAFKGSLTASELTKFSESINEIDIALEEYQANLEGAASSLKTQKRITDITTGIARDQADVMNIAKKVNQDLINSMIQDRANFEHQDKQGTFAKSVTGNYILGLDKEKASFRAMKGAGYLFSDQRASGQLGIDVGDISTGKMSGKDVINASAGGFAAQLKFDVKDLYKELREAGDDLGASLKASFKDAFKSFLDGSKNAGDALRSLGLSFANKLLDIAAQGTTNMLFGSLQNLGSAAWGAYKSPATGATGGYVTGGSGIRDDVPAMLNEGDFVLKQSSVNKYGVGFLNRLAGGGSAMLNPASPLSNFALSNDSNPQNAIRMSQESADLNALVSYQQAMDAFEAAKKQRRISALINLGVSAAAAGIGYGANKWAQNVKLNNAAQTPMYNNFRDPSFSGRMAASGGFMGHYGVQRFAGGGSVDNVPALLTGGEYVVNKSSVSRLGVGFMHRLNRGEVPMYNTGGFVGESIPGSTESGGNGLNDSISRLINSNEKLIASRDKSGSDGQMSNQSSQPLVGNISINVSVDNAGNAKADVKTEGSKDTAGDSVDQGKRLGEIIKSSVLDTIIKETRNGGILEQNFQRRR